VQVFVQAKGESIVINGEIIVTIVDILDEDVVLAVDAPEWIDVCKEEMLEELETVRVRPR
jgi:carbon storage regulator CsrA